MLQCEEFTNVSLGFDSQILSTCMTFIGFHSGSSMLRLQVGMLVGDALSTLGSKDMHPQKF